MSTCCAPAIGSPYELICSPLTVVDRLLFSAWGCSLQLFGEGQWAISCSVKENVHKPAVDEIRGDSQKQRTQDRPDNHPAFLKSGREIELNFVHRVHASRMLGEIAGRSPRRIRKGIWPVRPSRRKSS